MTKKIDWLMVFFYIDILLWLALIIVSISSCTQDKQEYKYYIVCGTDTIIVDNGNINVSKSRGGSYGRKDTVNETWTIGFLQGKATWTKDTTDDR